MTTEQLIRRIEELEDREEIRNVLNTFNVTADRKDMEQQGMLFTEDAKVIQHFGSEVNVLEGRKGIVDAFGAYLATTELTYHFSGQQMIRFIKDGEAEVLSYCFVSQKLVREGKTYLLNGGAHYRDRFVRTDTGWKIRQRDQYPDFQDEHEI